jgi:hypothetical protein
MNQQIKTLAEDIAFATGAFAQSTVVPIDVFAAHTVTFHSPGMEVRP